MAASYAGTLALAVSRNNQAHVCCDIAGHSQWSSSLRFALDSWILLHKVPLLNVAVASVDLTVQCHKKVRRKRCFTAAFMVPS